MAHAMAHYDNPSALFGIAALSALVGAAAGMMLAPKSGKQTRNDIMLKMHEARQRSRQQATEMKEAATDKIDAMRATTNEAIADKAADVKDTVAEARSQVEDAATEMQARPRTRRTAS